MICWKSINIDRHYGTKWVNLISTFITIITFIILNVPFSIMHQGNNITDKGIVYLLLAIILLPSLHSFMHILPLIIQNRRINLIVNRKKALPIYTFYTDAHISKNAFLLSTITPTLTITIPGLILAFLFPGLYVYFLIVTSINIGMSFLDFVTIRHLLKAPKHAVIEKDNEGFDILLKAN